MIYREGGMEGEGVVFFARDWGCGLESAEKRGTPFRS